MLATRVEKDKSPAGYEPVKLETPGFQTLLGST